MPPNRLTAGPTPIVENMGRAARGRPHARSERRNVLAAKALAEARWLDRELRRRYVVVAGKQPLSEQVSRESLAKKMTLTENGVEEDVVVVQKNRTHARPWRLSVDPIRALVDTCIAGVGYLL